jgi:DNA-binding GntR family transcriptional regulator
MSGSQRRPGLVIPSLVDTLAVALREQIFTGEIGAGEAVTELGVAEEFSVARPTAKAAVERLVHDGLLYRPVNKTARVPVLNIDGILDLYQARAFLERELVQALTIQGLVPEKARRHVRDLQTAGPNPVLNDVIEADIRFHSALFDALESPRLSRLYASIMGEVHLCMAQVYVHHLLQPAVIASEHIEILDAIASGDPVRAVNEAAHHIQHACELLVDHLKNRADRVSELKANDS